MTIGDLTVWVILLSVNFLDLLMIRMVTQAMLKRVLKITLRCIIFAIVYTITVALAYYFWGGYSLRTISTILLLLAIKCMADYRRINEVLVIYMVFVILAGTIQALVLVVVSFFGLNQELTFFISQLLTVVGVNFLCKKLKSHQLLHALQMNVVFKLTLFLVAFIILIIMFFFSYEHCVFYYLYFSVAVCLVASVFIPNLMVTYYKVIGLTSIHDLHNSLLSMGIMIEDVNDPEVIKDKFRSFSKKFDMDLSQLDFVGTQNTLNDVQKIEEKIENFVNIKKLNHGKAIEIDLELSYYKDCEQLDDPQLILEWLGTMLDNAIEATVSKPIFIYISSTTRSFKLRMANEYLGEKGREIMRIFDRGYSTKGEGRGIGLHNLYEEVTKLGGAVLVDEYYDEIHGCSYIQISIEFKREDSH